MVSIKPHFAFRHKQCKLPAPPGLRRDEPVDVEVVVSAQGGRALQQQLLLLPVGAVHTHPDAPVSSWPARQLVPQRGRESAGRGRRRMLQQGEGWETPREPFEISLELEMATPSTDGQQCQGQPYFATAPDAPLQCSLSAEDLPAGAPGGARGMQQGAAHSSREFDPQA